MSNLGEILEQIVGLQLQMHDYPLVIQQVQIDLEQLQQDVKTVEERFLDHIDRNRLEFLVPEAELERATYILEWHRIPFPKENQGSREILKRIDLVTAIPFMKSLKHSERVLREAHSTTLQKWKERLPIISNKLKRLKGSVDPELLKLVENAYLTRLDWQLDYNVGIYGESGFQAPDWGDIPMN